MKKRLLSILLIGCMLLMLLPAAVFAEDTATAVTEVATPEALTAALADDTVAAIQLTSDINISATLTIRRTVTLDLNGHVLKMTGSGSVFLIEGNDAKNYFGKLTLTDSNPEAVHKFTPNDAGLWVLNETDGTQTVTGGVITGGTGTSYTSSSIFGGGVHIRGGEFTMTGGNIVGCTASGGAACMCMNLTAKPAAPLRWPAAASWAARQASAAAYSSIVAEPAPQKPSNLHSRPAASGTAVQTITVVLWI